MPEARVSGDSRFGVSMLHGSFVLCATQDAASANTCAFLSSGHSAGLWAVYRLPPCPNPNVGDQVCLVWLPSLADGPGLAPKAPRGLPDFHPKAIDSPTRTTPPSKSATELLFKNGSKPLEVLSIFNLSLLWREQLL